MKTIQLLCLFTWLTFPLSSAVIFSEEAVHLSLLKDLMLSILVFIFYDPLLFPKPFISILNLGMSCSFV